MDLLIPQLPQSLVGLRILHLSDLHMKRRWWPAYDTLLNRVQSNPPDLILITGDFADSVWDHRPALATVERFLTSLRSRLGIYGIIGNHDRDMLSPRLGAWGVNYIGKKYIRLESDEASIELIGLPGAKRRDFDPDWLESLPARRPGMPRIVLGHYPDQSRLIGSLEADLMLAGHTHGGQVCLPGGRPLMTHDSLPKRMAKGVHRAGDTLLIVSRGLGTGSIPIRLFCPAEVIELRLVSRPAQT